MHHPWIEILKTLPLQKDEKEIFKRYEKDPEGRSFLAAAEILKSYKRYVDAIELLSWGVNRHPSFTVARVQLARELFHKGLALESLRLLEESPTALNENILAAKLKFRLYLLTRNFVKAKDSLQELKTLLAVDPETKRFADTFELQRPEIARDLLLAHLKGQGIELHLPEKIESIPLPEKIISIENLDEVIFKKFALSSFDQEQIRGFNCAHLSDIFSQKKPSLLPMDSLTLVDIYAAQGHNQKAAAMVRRLLVSNPDSEHLQNKLKNLISIADAPLSEEDIVETLEQSTIIDKKIAFYESLLNRLPT